MIRASWSVKRNDLFELEHQWDYLCKEKKCTKNPAKCDSTSTDAHVKKVVDIEE